MLDQMETCTKQNQKKHELSATVTFSDLKQRQWTSEQEEVESKRLMLWIQIMPRDLEN